MILDIVQKFLMVAGILSLISMLLGSAYAVLFISFVAAIKIFIASLLVFAFCIIGDIFIAEEKRNKWNRS